MSGNLSKPLPSPPAPFRLRVRELRTEPAMIENSVLYIWTILRQDVDCFTVNTFYVQGRTIVDSMWSRSRKLKINFRKF